MYYQDYIYTIGTTVYTTFVTTNSPSPPCFRFRCVDRNKSWQNNKISVFSIALRCRMNDSGRGTRGLLVLTQEQLTTTTINQKVPFLVRAFKSTTNISTDACLTTFESHQPSVVHPIQYFDTQDGCYLRDVNMNPPTFADSIRSGEAKKHDLYWAYYQSCGTTLPTTRAAQLFLKIEHALGLGDRRGASNEKAPLTVWAGPSGHVESLHYDDEDNLHVVICGTKEWVLYPPSAMCCGTATYVSLCAALSLLRTEGVLPWTGKRRRRTRGGVSSAVIPDDGRIAPGICVVMNAGDALWIPAGWHHQVSTKSRKEEKELDFVFSMNRFYPTSFCKLTCWSRYVVGRLVLFNWIVERCCRQQEEGS